MQSLRANINKQERRRMAKSYYVYGTKIFNHHELRAARWAEARCLEIPIRGDAFRDNDKRAQQRRKNWKKALKKTKR